MNPLEKIKTAIRDTRTLEYEDDDTLNTIAIAALNALKDPDEGTVEAMTNIINAGIGREVPSDLIAERAFTAAINHILKDGEP